MVTQALKRKYLNAVTTSDKVKTVSQTQTHVSYWIMSLCFSSLDVGTGLWPKEINMIGQTASTGSLFPLLYDLSLSTANSGSSHRTPACINILYRTHTEGFRAENSTQLLLQVSKAFKQLRISSLNYNV